MLEIMVSAASADCSSMLKIVEGLIFWYLIQVITNGQTGYVKSMRKHGYQKHRNQKHGNQKLLYPRLMREFLHSLEFEVRYFFLINVRSNLCCFMLMAYTLDDPGCQNP